MRKSFAAALVVALVFVTSWAGASWVVESNGDGAATSGAADALVVSPGVPTVALFPGGSGDVAVNVQNPNDWDVTITSFTGNGPVTSTDVECEAAGHFVTFTDQVGSWVVPANTTVDILLSDAASMGLEASPECQNVDFLVPLVLAG